MKVEEEGNFSYAHSNPAMPEDFSIYFKSKGDPDAAYNASEVFDAFDTQICFGGHSHVPSVINKNGEDIIKEGWIDLTDEKYMINIGSVGQPRDHISASCVCILDENERRVLFDRVPYNIEKTENKIKQTEFPSQTEETNPRTLEAVDFKGKQMPLNEYLGLRLLYGV